MGSGTVVSHNATRPCQKNSRRPLKGVARPWQPRHRDRCHACSRALPQTRRFYCGPGVGEGRNTMVRRGRCASPVSESVHGRLSSSKVIEEQNEEHHPEEEEPPASRRAV
jgi:hypothetical protein